MMQTDHGAEIFRFKKFEIRQDQCSMKVNTDAVLLGAWSDLSRKTKALDIGTGTGIIAIMMAQRCEQIISHGIEIDELAYAQAKYNMEHCIFASRLHVIHRSIQDYMATTTEKYDLIITNPPFFTGGTFSFNQNKANVRHTIKLPHSDLLRAVKNLLIAGGHFDIILPFVEGLKFIEMAEKYDLGLYHQTEVRSRLDKNIERLLMRFEAKYRSAHTTDELIIYNSTKSHDYTQHFIGLTKDFYLFM